MSDLPPHFDVSEIDLKPFRLHQRIVDACKRNQSDRIYIISFGIQFQMNQPPGLHPMAEHEAEMQRQMLSVPPMNAPGTESLGLPPNSNLTSAPPAMVPPPSFNPNWTDEVDKANSLQPLMSVKVDKPEDDDNKQNEEVVLPKALEDVFAFKDQLADELGRKDGEIPTENERAKGAGVLGNDYTDVDADSEDEDDTQDDNQNKMTSKSKTRVNKNKKKKQKRKENRKMRQVKQNEFEEKAQNGVEPSNDSGHGESKSGTATEDDVSVEYVPEKITVADLAPMYRQFYRVFELFKHEDKPILKETDVSEDKAEQNKSKEMDDDGMQADDDDDDMNDGKKDDKEKLSKRKLKKLTRLSVAELKQLVNRPDVVEMHDVTARDPKLLVQLKAHRNTVQTPRHWCFKRKYLQGKRGIEKPPFDLPAFIKKTGIMEMRESLQEKDEAKTLKAKMRERARPKMGKIDIDYQKLHDAFFKWQTKPRMVIHGDLYYEGKEFETRLKEKKPGDLSEELRTALGMPIGPNCHKIPPPWLIAQQRYGPPPSYPNLKIPGLNAPIPEGTSFGYHAGGWGKPPVDEKGKPLYGDVFGTNALDPDVS